MTTWDLSTVLLCKNCGKPTARVVSKGELYKLSKGLAPLAGLMAAAAAKAGPAVPGALLRLVKAAPKDPKALLIGAGITLAVTAATHGIKYLFDRTASDDKKYEFCPECRHHQPMS
ncbi:hypothetical protein SAMN05660967_04260 [Pseudomonas sp. URMO17WK12:I9]|nr:hypothetical protein SAMN05660967_04260 [Pseudomonas sp. URMO17WK12:I9]